MSMLADRKRKQKWSLNPNGKEWSQDSNKFGQKLLEKMGWQHGKGLGAKENGVTEHIKVSHKIDSRGMGYKETNDQWTEHESNFTALLAALSGDKSSKDETNEVQLKSLEKKSQNSRARVHYHKFTRGKDLSRYSEKDLANIFGKKSLKSEPKKEIAEKADTEKESGLYFNGGSMKDYFKKKIPSFGKINDFIVGNNGVLKKAEDSESESDMKPSFGFGFKSEETSSPSVTSNQTFISYIQENKTPSKRKAEQENSQEGVFSPSKKHKKDKKQKKSDLGVSNPAFNPLASPNRILQKHVLDPIEESPSEYIDQNVDTYQSGENSDSSEKLDEKEKENNVSYVSIKKKRKENTIDDSNTIEIRDQHIQDITESQKKSQKKKKRQTDIASLELESKIKASESDSKDKPNEDETNSDSKKRKRDKLLYDNPSFQIQNISLEESSTISDNPYEIKLSAKKQKKKNKLLNRDNLDDADKNNRISKKDESTVVSMEIVNAGFDDSSNTITETCSPKENPYEVKIRGKKKSKKFAMENPNFDGIDYISEENDHEVKPKKSKKSKGKAVSDMQQENIFKGEENKETNNDSIILEDCDLKSESQEKTHKKKKRQTEKASESDSKDKPNEDETNSASKKRRRDKLLYDNPTFQIHNISMEESSTISDNPYEVKVSAKKQKKKNKLLNMDNLDDADKNNRISKKDQSTVVSMEIVNAGFDDTANTTETCSPKENPYEVKIRAKKNSKKFAVENPNFDGIDYISEENDHEEKPKKSKKSKGKSVSDIQQENIFIGEENKETNNDSIILEDCDLILNVVSTPIIKTVKTPGAGSVARVNDLRRRKSVRFSDVTQELIIPNNDDLREMYDNNNAVPANLDSISKTLDNFQAEMENDINEEKVKTVSLEDIMVGEVGNPHGENEKLPEGTKLKFKYANLNAKTPFYQMDKVGPKKSYKHLIKGDIVVKFRNTNLHEIEGYGIKNKTAA